MTLIELGALASAVMAIITLLIKLVTLIHSVSTLIKRLDIVWEEAEENKAFHEQMTALHHDSVVRLTHIEQQIGELQTDVKELSLNALSTIY